MGENAVSTKDTRKSDSNICQYNKVKYDSSLVAQGLFGSSWWQQIFFGSADNLYIYQDSRMNDAIWLCNLFLFLKVTFS